jgi:hypothetical protein
MTPPPLALDETHTTRKKNLLQQRECTRVKAKAKVFSHNYFIIKN